MAQIVGERVNKGDVIVDYDEKLFDDIQANEGEKAYIFMHTVPFEGSVGLRQHADRDPDPPEGLRHQHRALRAGRADGLGHPRLPDRRATRRSPAH